MKLKALSLFLSLSFTFALFGLYFIHVMMPKGMYPWWDSYGAPMLAGLCIGTLGHAVWKFFDDVNGIRIALEVKGR